MAKLELDIKLNKEERLNQVKEYFKDYTSYHEYFDEKLNVHPKQTDKLSHDDKVCKQLESIANYLLFSGESNNKKDVEYNFYTINQLKNKYGSDLSYNELLEKSYNDEVFNINTINFLLENKNYKKAIEQKIFSEDIKDVEPIADYELFKTMMNNKLKQLRSTNSDKSIQRKIVKTLKEVKSDQILCKDMIKGTIYFKAPLPDSTDIDYDQFDFFDIKHVRALLLCTNTNAITDLGCLVQFLNFMLDNIKMTDVEKEILSLYRSGKTQVQISEIIGNNPHNISTTISSICKRLIKYYFSLYEDWYYLNICKGEYKKCSRCGEIKLISNFGKHPLPKDKLYPCCKSCR